MYYLMQIYTLVKADLWSYAKASLSFKHWQQLQDSWDQQKVHMYCCYRKPSVFHFFSLVRKLSCNYPMILCTNYDDESNFKH